MPPWPRQRRHLFHRRGKRPLRKKRFPRDPDHLQGQGNNIIVEESKGLNPALIVLLVVVALLLLFFVGNYALYVYARKTLPPKKKKPISKKKMKKEKLRQGVSAPGE